jgi:hypothetical protein
MKMKVKSYQFSTLIDTYNQLNQDQHVLTIMAEFIARYRFLTLAVPNEMEKMYHEDLKNEYISPLRLSLEKKYVLKPNTATRIISCIDKILETLLSSKDRNDTWTISFMIAVYRAPGYQVLHRQLSEEMTIHHLKQLKKNFRSSPKNSKKNPIKIKSTLNESMNISIDRHYYLKTHLPENFDAYFRSKYTLIFSLLLLLFLFIKLIIAGDFKLALGTLCMTPLVIVGHSAIASAVNICLPSYLNFDNMPGHFSVGLLTEIKENIEETIAFYEKQLPRKCLAVGKKKFPGLPIIPSPPAPPALLITDHSLPMEAKNKIKTRSSYPSLSYELALSPVVYRWKTRQYGEIKFQPDKVNERLFALWSISKHFDNRYVVLFPRENLPGDKALITYFWNTARVGRIVHPKEHAGYVYITEQEKKSDKYPFFTNTLFKIKTPPHSLYGAYRQPVSICELEKASATHLTLLCAQTPMKTH